MHAVHDGIFWPPASEVPRFDDGLATLCFDSLRNRAALIKEPAGEPLFWPPLATFASGESTSEVRGRA
jgi:hypothetical protein